MSAIQTVVYDFGTLSLLILLGYFIRKRVRLFQDLYLPASLVAGFLGLLAGPQVLGSFSPIYFPIAPTIGSWAGVLTAVVFSVSFLGAKQKDFGEAALSTSVHAGISHQLQVIVGLICAFIFMSFYDIPLGFGLTPVYGWYGGHGTALAAGTLFKELGWEGGLDVANTMATAGLVCGVIFGVVMINIGARKGKTKYVREPSQIPREIKVGYIEPESRQPIGKGVTHNDVVDPFGFALCWCGLICTMGHLVRSGLIAIHPLLSNIPWFACCLILSMVVGTIMKKTKMDRYIDRPSMQRISGTTMDYLVCAAICTLNLNTVATYLVPLLVTNAAILLTNWIAYPYFGRKLYKRDAFERTVGAFGQGCGVLATGLMLVRIIDPKGESTAADAIAASSTIGYILFS
ncbi:MAG: sodium/glutamate symporter [Christensenellales bacterium]|jgi:ESS family glutamate:Na+ symporter